MTDRDAFIRAICAAPGGDTPRLAFADWLDEHAEDRECWSCQGYGPLLGAGPDRGNPTCSTCGGTGGASGDRQRAEFIRVQCEQAGTLCHQPESVDEVRPRTPWSMYCNDSLCRHCDLDRRASDLLQSASGKGYHCWEWAGPAKLIVPDGARWTDHLDWRRGFIESVSLPLAAFIGGPCRHCRDGWFIDVTGIQGECPYCMGRGRTGGHTADLFRNHPIERVTLTCRRPWRDRPEELWGWWCAGVGHTDDGDVLPVAIMDAMDDDARRADRSVGVRHRKGHADGGCILFGSEADAVAALSDGCVAHGRRLAGLSEVLTGA